MSDEKLTYEIVDDWLMEQGDKDPIKRLVFTAEQVSHSYVDLFNWAQDIATGSHNRSVSRLLATLSIVLLIIFLGWLVWQ